ncbi:acyl carrier protein [Nitrosospira briensis]|uniref:Acyl carrier protein n=1 Tax=Nitrosospira briensis TaxID=35799 RepID=A0A1I4Y5V1_9PROT|nr:acyl carrier protein [Nitrosospira briensis]SFN32939.1 acyl carrier protein [Nitrosospira briensis]SFN69429.1 acyl carrier protein [Nitrosospira briensis]
MSEPTTARMNDDQVLSFLRSELRAIRPTLPPTLPVQANFRTDLLLDSLDLVELVARIERRYALIIPDQDLPEFVSLEATVRYIFARVSI